ncbi:MAG: PKD domain-containing protein [Sporichthyaceae bacterium]|nr:PKD domain-containing protein [Sporichthyaceae bacterium]
MSLPTPSLPMPLVVGDVVTKTGQAGPADGLPYTVTVNVRITGVDWGFGDGTTTTTSGIGSEGVGSDISHTYLRLGQPTVTVTVHWHGTFSVDGGPSQDIPGGDIEVTQSLGYTVREIHTVLN